ncbi:unnamed protein product [Clavelina lepadiformis]|uniref:Alkaline phosphatase n=1 Tax=Clavelina lepadiformis TaxID=159417 RepID=A0ABP0H5B0_CLALP
MRILVALLTIALTSVSCNLPTWSAEEETPEYWYNVAKEELQVALKQQTHNMNVAKNVILFLGDGMSVATITAGRILKGQLRNNSGEEYKLAMDRFHHAGLSRTYAVNKQVADSASTGTAYLCGVKSTYGTLGVSAKARRGDCLSEKGNAVDSVLIDADKEGRSTGIVTTTRINHATPAATYSHSAERTWYGDDDLSADAVKNGCKDLAQQFYDSSAKITVALGGGRKYFMPNNTRDPEYRQQKNSRNDGQDLIKMWLNDQVDLGLEAQYVWNKEDFDNVDVTTTDKLLGLFEPSDMKYESNRDSDGAGEPSITEMTEKAIRILQKNSKGYFLLVEGGRIDHAHHATNAFRALHEMVAFDDAIERAVAMTSDHDTLIIVTADHSHTLSMGGYSDRGNPILGLASANGVPYEGLDKKPFTTLTYANGIGYQGPGTIHINNEPHSRRNLSDVNTERENYLQQSAIPLPSETHGGDDVAILARGPMSHLFHGVHQQNYIPYVMRYVACMGSDRRYCDEINVDKQNDPVQETTQYLNFLGISLTEYDIQAALYAELALLVLFFIVIHCLLWFVLGKSNAPGAKPREKGTKC